MPRTYQKLFKQKAVITNIDRKVRLGFRLYWDDLATFAISWVVFAMLDMASPYRIINLFMNRWVAVTLSAGGFTWLARKLDPDGKSLVKYLYGFVAYPFRSHVSDGFVRKPRTLVWRRGRRSVFRVRARAWWTRGDLRLPVRIQLRSPTTWRFENSVHVDVKLRRHQVDFHPVRRMRRPGRYRLVGLRPGTYQVEGRKVTKIDR